MSICACHSLSLWARSPRMVVADGGDLPARGEGDIASCLVEAASLAPAPDSNFICLQSRNRFRAEQLGRALSRGCAEQQDKLSDGQGEKPIALPLLCSGEMLQSEIVISTGPQPEALWLRLRGAQSASFLVTARETLREGQQYS